MIEMRYKKFNRLTVVALWEVRNNKNPFWECKCDCGKTVIVAGSKLRNNHTKSCGCLKVEMFSNMTTKHGGRQDAEYRVWCDMKARCGNKTNKSYQDYGGRGISACEQWINSYSSFISDMGKRPSNKHSIERIDVNGNYEPSNCRWATKLEQNRNRRITLVVDHNGQRISLAEACEKNKISYGAVKFRKYRKGIPLQEAYNYYLQTKP